MIMYLRITQIDINLYNEVTKLSPFGPGNLKPRFLLESCTLNFIKVVGDNHHSLLIEDDYGNRIRGIIFNSVNQELGKFLENFLGKI